MSRVLENAKNQITCGYNAITHKGVDLVKYKSQVCYIIAHTDGEVVWVQRGQTNNPKATGNASYGNCVKLKHGNGYYTLYAHLKFVDVKLGQKVKQGTRIGYMGDSGRAFKCHLHFEVRNEKDNRINPTPYIDADLPITNDKYQAYDNKKDKWLPFVKVGSKDYAGNIGHAISGFRISNFKYKAYDMIKQKWLPEVNGLSDYAGNLPNNIGAIAINTAGKYRYRVHLLYSNRWLTYVTGYNTKDFFNGFAGNLNEPIDAIQVDNI